MSEEIVGPKERNLLYTAATSYKVGLEMEVQKQRNRRRLQGWGKLGQMQKAKINAIYIFSFWNTSPQSF